MIKRIYLTILVMLFAVSGLYAQAPKISIGDVLADPGEVLVPVYIENFSDLAAMTLLIEYDKEVLDYVGIANQAYEGIWFDNANNGLIQINWAIFSGGQDNPADGHLLDLRLEYRGGFRAELNFNVNECEFTTAAFATVTGVVFEGGSVGPASIGGTISMAAVGATIGNPVSMPVTFEGEGFDGVSSFSLFIEINPTQLEYTGLVPAEGVTNLMANETNGVINVMWTGDPTDFNELDGPAFTIGLIYRGGGIAPLRFKGNSEVINEDFKYISVDFVDGLVFLDVPDGSASLKIDDVYFYTEEVDSLVENLIDVVIYAADFGTAVSSVNLVIGFDNNEVSFESASSAQLPGLAVNPQGNRIFVAWTNTTGVEIEDGEFIVLTFSYTDFASTDLTFLGGSDLIAPSMASIPVSFVNGSLKITNETFLLTLIAEPEEGGVVTGAGEFPYGELASVDAVANTGYEFVNWTLPDGTVVSEEAANDIFMDADLTLIANFAMVEYTLTLIADPEDGGEVIGAGVYTYFDEIEVDAIPAEGYAFVNWTLPDGTEFSDEPANTLTELDSDLTLIANFEMIDYTLTLVANPLEGGTVTGAGVYNFGDIVPVNAVPAVGYAFVSWTDADGEVVSTQAANDIPMPSSNLTLTANFELVDYTLTLLVSPAGAGTVTGAGTYNFGEEVAVDAVANAGFKFVNWTDADGEEVSTSPDNLITMPASNLTLTANFVALYNVTFNVNMMYVDGFYHRLTFNAASDVVYVTGSMFGWQQPGMDPDNQTLAPKAGDPMIYTNTVQLEAGDYQYKYFLNAGWSGDEWAGDPNRTFSVVNADVVLNDWFGSQTNPTNVNKPEVVEMKVYPNPVRSILNIESGSEILEVRMMDMLGQLVYAAPVKEYRTQLNVSELRNGIYFVQVLTSEGFVTHRVQVTK